MDIQFKIVEHEKCLTITFDNSKSLLTIDIWTGHIMSYDQIWMYVLGYFDIPRYEVWRAYNPDLNPEHYNIANNFAKVIWEFFGSEFLGEKMVQLDW